VAGHPEPPVNGNQQQAMNSDAMRRVSPLPDIVPSTNIGSAPLMAPIPPPRRGTTAHGDRPRPHPPPRRPRRRRGTCCNEKSHDVPTDDRTREDWKQVGKELRKIADEFHSTSRLEVGE